MKFLIALILTFLFISCKKEQSKNTAIQYSKFGVDQVGGRYYANTQLKINYPNKPETVFDSDYSVDIKYLGNGKIKFDLNSKLNLPDSLKHIYYSLVSKIESVQANNSGMCFYYFQSDKKYKPFYSSDSVSYSTLNISMNTLLPPYDYVESKIDFTYFESIINEFSAERK
jgi:hypothetical protein